MPKSNYISLLDSLEKPTKSELGLNDKVLIIDGLNTFIRCFAVNPTSNEDGIHVYNRDGISASMNPFDLFPELDLLQEDAPHAFYMGVELARAQIALQLGKKYMQDEELDWGVATNRRTEEQKKEDIEATHNMRELRKQSNEYKSEGSTLKARKKRIKQK